MTALPASDPFADIADTLRDMDPAELEAFAALLEPEDVDLLEQILAGLRTDSWTPQPHQVPPDWSWFLWLMLAGRGAGKTDACAHEMDRHMMGPPCVPGLPGGHRAAIIAPTLGDAIDACVNGPSGVRAHNAGVRAVTRRGGTFAIWPNDAEARVFGAYTPQDVERLRAGGNRCFVWCDELAAWRYLRACWNHMELGLRLGREPRVIASTTPKNRPHLKKLIRRDDVAVTRARTDDNKHLSASRRGKLYHLFEGTRLGRQELDAELLDDVEGALWTQEMIEADRLNPRDVTDADVIPNRENGYRRIVVAVDPSWGTKGDEVGIVVAGLGWNGHGYVLGDHSGRMSPTEWGETAADAYDSWKADAIVGEVNYSAEQVRLVMQTVSQNRGRRYRFKEVRATRGKVVRAEPIVALYEQHRVHHVGFLPFLEHQMTSWVPGAPRDEDADGPDGGGEIAEAAQAQAEESETVDDELLPSDFSPDRVDALVWALTDLLVDRAPQKARGRTSAATRSAPTAPTPPGTRRAAPAAGRATQGRTPRVPRAGRPSPPRQ